MTLPPQSIPSRTWNLAAGLILFAVTVLALAQWPAYPYFLDSAYHLAVIRGFREAGGPVLHAFWEAAPEGHPHLYPPLFHLLWAPASTLNIPPMVMARLWSFAAFPLLLLAAWIVLSRVFTARTACLTLIALATPYSFFLAAVNYLPATLVLAATLGILLALHEKRWLAGGLLLALSFWTHASFPWLITLALILFGWFEPSFRKTAWAIVCVGIAGGSPWIFHLLRHFSELHLHPRGEERFFETSPFLLALGLIGLKLAWSRGGLYRFLVALAVGFLPMLAGWRFRYFSSQGLFAWLLLSGIALEWLVEKIRRPWLRLKEVPRGFPSVTAPLVISESWAIGLLLGGLLLGAPGVHWSTSDHPLGHRGLHWAWADTTFAMLAGRPAVIPRATAQPVFRERFLKELVETVQARTNPNDLITSNYDYVALMLGARTGRAVTNLGSQDPVAPARLVVWVKDPSGQPSENLKEIASKYSLRFIQETEIALVYQNPKAQGQKKIRPAAVPGWVGFGLIGLAFGAVVWDFRR